MDKRAKINMLNELFAFPTIYAEFWNPPYKNLKVQSGDLVTPMTRVAGKFYLAWVLDIGTADICTGNKYLLQSIDNGKSAWWEDIAFNIFDRVELKKHPWWKWTDEQFEFKDKWMDYGKKHGNPLNPSTPKFNDYEVVMQMWDELAFDDELYNLRFDDYREVDFDDYIEYCHGCYENKYNTGD